MFKFHITGAYNCSYLPGKLACSEVVTPDNRMDTQVYGKLVQAGFRRSGYYTYRPNCAQCRACLSVRVVINDFSPNRAQRRAWKQHQYLTVSQLPLHYNPEHYELYQRYQAQRHAGGGMDHDCFEQYHNFLLQSHVNSLLVEFRDNQRLCMVSIVDILPDGLSAVYTFFDAEIKHASFGTYNILWQIEQCQLRALPYLYLGYWIKENNKMRYKANFQPIEVLQNNQWKLLANGDSL